MKRKLFTAASLLSLLMCAGTVVVWVRSYWRRDEAYVAREWFESKTWTNRTLRVCSGRGGFNLGWSVANTVEANVEWGAFPNRIGKWHVDHRVRAEPMWPSLSDEVEPGRGYLGIAFGYSNGFFHAAWRDGYQWEFVAPSILPAIIFSGLPSLWALNRLHLRRRLTTGACVRCGYSLTANTSGVCPECGTDVCA